LQSALYFLPAYLLGMYLGKRPGLLSFLMPYAVWGFIICVLVLIDYGHSIFSDTRWDLLLKLITTCFLIALCQAKLNFKIKWLDLFARLSFYLFFVHGYVIGAFRIYLRHSEHHYMGIGAALGIFITTLILCLMAYILFKWLFQNHSKFILGA
jgi:peptidoglycan/LPS O-acetylase OafA/YrhL